MQRNGTCMEGSLDSIGSCSLDVEADSTDFSDTSGSLIYVAQSAAREEIPEKITIRTQETCYKTTAVPSFKTKTNNTTLVEINTPNIEDSTEKKPSYLNLACCVNGYSRLTAYDSIFRKNLNRKSRELSPINITTNPIQLAELKNSNFLVSSNLLNDKEHKRQNNNLKMEKNSYDTTDRQNADLGNCDKKSFIQERVERLYGPDALSQNLFSPKQIRTIVTETSPNSPIKYSTQIDKNYTINNHYHEYNNDLINYSETGKIPDNSEPLDLPVLRHLRPEFRAQLSIVSPKKDNKNSAPSYVVSGINYQNTNKAIVNGKNIVNENKNKNQNQNQNQNQNDNKNINENENENENGNNDQINNNSTYKNGKYDDVIEISYEETNHKSCKNENQQNGSNLVNNITNNEPQNIRKDGAFFIKVLRSEQNRLLDLATETENDLDKLLKNPEITEDMLGYLRSASGKAKLLVSKKMKQFEGLCNKNMKPSPDDQFVTTIGDLQGFWDMIYLQIEHVDALFNEIEQFKKNNWKKPENTTHVPMVKTTKESSLIKASKQQKKASISSATTNAKKAETVALISQQRDAQRKQFLELRRKNKLAMNSQQTSENTTVELFVNENCT